MKRGMLLYNLKYWGLRENPFSNTPTPHFFYRSLQHKEALERMFFVSTNPELYMGLLTGNVGTGKTLISRLLEAKLKNKCLTLYVPNGFIDFTQVICRISALMIQKLLRRKMPPAKIQRLLKKIKIKDKDEILYIFYQCLKRYVKYFKRNLTIIIDECHRIDKDELIALKGITNYMVEFKPVISLILTGQKDIIHLINTTEELKSRISLVYSLKGFELTDTYNYIMYRLSVAGGKVPIFSKDAISVIHEHTGGIPREINRIAMLALQYGALNKTKRITADLILRIFSDQYGMLKDFSIKNQSI